MKWAKGSAFLLMVTGSVGFVLALSLSAMGQVKVDDGVSFRLGHTEKLLDFRDGHVNVYENDKVIRTITNKELRELLLNVCVHSWSHKPLEPYVSVANHPASKYYFGDPSAFMKAEYCTKCGLLRVSR